MPPSSPWLPRFTPTTDARLRLYCLPHAGGTAAAFQGWRQASLAGIDVVPIELPGRAGRMAEPSFETMDALVRALSHALAPFLDRPFALFGHSLGALVAFELAHQLRAAAAPPVHLFVSGHAAPRCARASGMRSRSDAALLQTLRELGGTPAEVYENRDLLEFILPPLRADFAILDAYACERVEPLDVPITAFGGADDPHTDAASLDAWQQETRARFRRCIVPGGHFFLDASRENVLSEITEALAPVLRTGSSGRT